MTHPEVAAALAVLENNPDYRVLKRLQPPAGFYHPATGGLVQRGIYLDTETTGKEAQVCEIIELALVPFIYEAGGRLLAIREDQCVSFLNEPKAPLTDEIRRITGIEPEDIAGHKLDIEKIDVMLAGVDMVIAHNAGYDRKVLERYIPSLRFARWACSQQDVPWREVFRAPAEKLEVLAHFLGNVFYSAHRAMIDCIAGVHVLATVADMDGKTAFEYLYESAHAETLRIWAIGAPFETKDTLRDHGYRWNDGRDGRPKAWNKRVTASQLDEENTWLKVTCQAYPRVTEVAAEDRYSIREG